MATTKTRKKPSPVEEWRGLPKDERDVAIGAFRTDADVFAGMGMPRHARAIRIAVCLLKEAGKGGKSRGRRS